MGLRVVDKGFDVAAEEVLSVIEVLKNRRRFQLALDLQKVTVLVRREKAGVHKDAAGLCPPAAISKSLSHLEPVDSRCSAFIGLSVDNRAESHGSAVQSCDGGRFRRRRVVALGGGEDQH